MDTKLKAAPILKWAGGKGRLIAQMRQYLEPPSERWQYYVEPFVGGAALLCWMLNEYGESFEGIIANDNNSDLIGMYRTVKTDVESLIGELERLQQGIRTAKEAGEYYLARRQEFNDPKVTDPIVRASLLIFLNKTCYNGLYRVNKKGEFNVPFGKRSNVTIYDPMVLRMDSEAFKCVEFMCGDYSKATVSRHDRALYYFDPPYRPLTPTSSFTGYTQEAFGEAEQIRLAEHCRQLDEEGADLMISNADTSEVNPTDDFYTRNFPSQSFRINKVMAPRFVNADSSKRGPIPEVLITNFPKYTAITMGCSPRAVDIKKMGVK